MEPFITNRYIYGPYGEPLHYDNEKERQGFIGKERDLESGLADHGVRKYDYISGRFTSTDPLWEKYMGLTPYQYSANNPIYYLDKNGKDAVGVIENNTITIKAVYVVSNYSNKEIVQMQNEINQTLNNANHCVSEGQYSGYSVKFDLKFVNEDDQFSQETSIQGIDISNTLDKRAGGTYEEIQKSMVVDFRTKDLGFGLTGTNGGYTFGDKWIFMNSDLDNTRRKIHEIFHTFYDDRDKTEKGIMNYEPGIELPNTNDINYIINSNKLPIINY